MRLLAGVADQGDLIRVGDETLSADGLLGRSAAVAADVRGARVVAVHAVPGIRTVVAIVGALRGGAAVVPLPPDSGPAEAGHILRDSGAEVLLADGDHPATSVEVRPVDLRRTAAANPAAPDPGSAALILYTSGTTGPPKGAILSHGAVEAGLDALAEAWAWTPDDVLVHGLPLFHVHGLVLGVLGPLRVGSRLRHTVRPAPAQYAKAGGTLFFGVPTVWSRICADPDAARRLAGARLLVSGSAALPGSVFERLHALTGHRPAERYGMTETLITVSNRADDPDRRPGQVGRPVAGVETRLVD